MTNDRGAENHAEAPRHVAIIMDGNGRWAKQRGLPRIRGHEAGTENIRRITTRAGELGIQHLTLWAFSTDNWARPDDEVQGILRILAETIPRERDELHRQGARLRHIGSLENLDQSLVDAIQEVVDLTQHNTQITLTLAFNYSGRADIVRAMQRIARSGVEPDEIDESFVSGHLDTAGIPDPDLIIRTSGEMRMSNFFLWQAAYAEWLFTPVLWPDFDQHQLELAIDEYQSRERRFGGLMPPNSPGDDLRA